jgi:hypothetical protein
MCRVIRQTPKTCLAFKILAAGRHCATQQDVGEAFRYALGHIKEQDAVVVGMYPRHEDRPPWMCSIRSVRCAQGGAEL